MSKLLELVTGRLHLERVKGGVWVLKVTYFHRDGSMKARYVWQAGNYAFAQKVTAKYGGPKQLGKDHWAVVAGHNGVIQAVVMTSKAYQLYTAQCVQV